MKTIKLIALGIVMFFASSTMNAQLSINLHLGSAPSWGPSGYDASVNYYYLPDIQAYYDIRASQFIYLNGGYWTRSRYLPRQYRNYDLDHGYKVVMNDYHGSRPYYNYRNDRVRYYKGYKGNGHENHGRYENHGNNNNHGNNGNRENRGNNDNHDNNDHKEGRGNNGHGNDNRGDNGDRGDKGNNGRGNDKH